MAKSEVFKYDPSRARVRERPRFQKAFTRPSRTKQEFKDECDINMLMKRYKATGLFPQYPDATPRYVSNIGMPDFQEALEIVRVAESEFAALNSELRKRFDNDPAKFLAFVNDSANADELVKLGLREAPKPPAEPIAVRVVDPPSETPS